MENGDSREHYAEYTREIPIIAPGNSPSSKKRSLNKNVCKSKIISSIIMNKDKTKRIHVLRNNDACVHVVDQTYFDAPNKEDVCYLAFITTSTPKLATVQEGADKAKDPAAGVQVISDDTAVPKIPKEYEDLAEAFSTSGEMTLPEHGPQDLAIDLMDGKIPSMGPLYNLSESELQIVQTYVKDMTEKGLIRPSTSPTGAPIFIRKKERWNIEVVC